MRCLGCDHALPPGSRAEAAIAVFAAGDEVIYSYWRCPRCGAWTGEAWHDRFLGDSDAHCFGPLTPDLGQRCVALVARCPAPQDKLCGCPSHQALRGGLP